MLENGKCWFFYSFKDVHPNEWNGCAVDRKELIMDRDG
jgi:hypothetical protein